MLTKRYREKIEDLAIDQIMTQEGKFNFKKIVLEMRKICSEDVSTDEIIDIVFETIEFCLEEKLISSSEGDKFSIDIKKQTTYFSKNGEDLSL